MEKELVSVKRKKSTNDNESKLELEKDVINFKNISVIAIALSIIALVLNFACIFVYHKTGLGISIFVIFVIFSITIEIVNANKMVIKLKRIDSEEINIKILRELYQISFIVFAINITECVFIVPYFNNFNIKTVEYFGYIPIFLTYSMITISILRVISHLRLKNNSIYQYAEAPLNFFSRKFILVIVIFFIITFDIDILSAIIIPISIEYIILLPIFYGIVSLFNIE
jgi:hypothetical protein